MAGKAEYTTILSRPFPFLTILQIFLFVLCIIAVGYTGINGSDIWWHLKTGELILQEGRIPTTDPFSYTAIGERWVDSQWLFQVVIHKIHQLFGFQGLAFLKAFLLGIIMLGVWHSLPLKRQTSPHYVLLFMILVLLAVSKRIGVRPELFAYALLALEVAILRSYKQSFTYWILLLPFIKVFWVNVHSTHYLGDFVILATLAGSYYEQRKGLNAFCGGGSNFDDRSLKWLLGIAIVHVSASFLFNANGVSGALFPFQLLMEMGPTASKFMRTVGELYPSITPGNIFQVIPLTDLVFRLSFLLLLWIVYRTKYKMCWTDIILAVGFSYLALTARRNIPFFFIALSPMLAAYLFGALSQVKSRWKSLGFHFILAGLMLFFCLDRFHGDAKSGPFLQINRPFGVGVVQYLSPTSEILKVKKFLRKTDRIYNSPSIGGLLIYVYYPRLKVFMDSRFEVYQKLHHEIFSSYKNFEAFEKMLDRHQVTLAIIHKFITRDLEYAKKLERNDNWRVQFDGRYLLILRKVTERPVSGHYIHKAIRRVEDAA